MRQRIERTLSVLAMSVVFGACGQPQSGAVVDAEPPRPRRDASLGDAARPELDAETSDAEPRDAAGGVDATSSDAEVPGDAARSDAAPALDAEVADAAPPPDVPAPPTRPPCQNEGARRACPPLELELCPTGVQVCEGGAWSVCRGPAETCDDTDEDCDGAIDEGLGKGEVCVVGVGACGRDGVGQCAPDGTLACIGRPGQPRVEACNGEDDDCDGTTDEDFGAGALCSAGVGACRREGVVACSMNGLACDAVAGEAGAELCNAQDDDCDGATDEGFDLGTVCSVGVGVCARQGQVVCGLLGQTTCSARPGRAGVETCNGLDDDCDGETDEDFALGTPCGEGQGACAVRGVLVCDDAGAAVCSVRAGAPEVCDALDNDCDGRADEGFDVGAACVAGGGACVAEGVIECTPQGRAVCSAQSPFALDVGDGSDGELIVAGRVELEADRPYQFSRVEVLPGGVLALRAAPLAAGRLNVRVLGATVVRAGGRIDLDGAGYAGGPANPKVDRVYADQWTNGGGSNGVHGQGPGGGGGGWSAPQQTVGSGGGAGYGAAGTDGVRCGVDGRNYTVWDDNIGGPLPIAAPQPRYSSGGPVYADADLLTLEPGSGGGAGANNYDGGAGSVGGAGGAGGGALRWVSTTLTVEAGGEISADGLAGAAGVGGSYVGGGGGGSGGAVYLTAIVLRVEGTLSALGGAGGIGTNGSQAGVGGVGRIRIDAGVVEALANVSPAAGRNGEFACMQ